MNCQVRCIDEICEKNTWFYEILQYTGYPHSIRKFRSYLWKRISPLHGAKTAYKDLRLCHDVIKPGDTVRIGSKAEIIGTLDRYNKTGRCVFQKGMYAYCEKECQVLKKVDYFFDEAKGKFCKCNHIFLLEGCYCDGSTAYLKPCDRNCFYFWHTSWLNKI